jgi:hypothetical protein
LIKKRNHLQGLGEQAKIGFGKDYFKFPEFVHQRGRQILDLVMVANNVWIVGLDLGNLECFVS